MSNSNKEDKCHCCDCKDTTIKVPVILAEPKIQVHIDTTITFPTPVLEIKDIKKRLKITQCKLLLPGNKLFIKGFVRKNIQYASPVFGTPTTVHSSLQSLTVDLPFTHVEDLKGKFIKKPLNTHFSYRDEIEYASSTDLSVDFPASDHLIAGSLSQFSQVHKEYLNELPFCELIWASFVEFDEAINRTQGSFSRGVCKGKSILPFEEGIFTKLEEKLVVDFQIKVLQKQPVKVSDEC